MKKLTVLILCLSVLLGSALWVALDFRGKGSGESRLIRLCHIDPLTHPHNLASQRFAEIVTAETGGAIQVEIYPAGQLGNAVNLMEQLQLGTIQMFQGGVGWWGSTHSDYWLLASNFVYDNLDHCAAIMTGPIGDRVGRALSEKADVRVLSQGMVRNPRNLLATRPVRSLKDLQGLKIRVPEMPNWIIPWKGLGANPTPMPLTETFLGLQQGVVDGVEHGLPQLQLNGYTEVAKFLSMTQHQFEMAGFFINDTFFQRLTGEQQSILLRAAAEAQTYNNKLQVEYLSRAERAIASAGVEFIELDRKPWYDVGRKIMQSEVVSALEITPGLLEEIRAYEY